MGVFGKVSVINNDTASVILISENVITGYLSIPEHITELAIGDTVMCMFTAQGYSQGVIIAKMR